MRQQDSADLPLARLRAVVFTQAVAGAFTTKLLADMGAEVIQIESLTRPDPIRGGFPPELTGTYPDNLPGERPYNRNANFNSLNTNKLGITLDLRHQEAKDIFLDLVRASDIVAENFAARVMPNFGLDYEALREVNPSVIMLRMPAFGCYGPYSHYMGNGGTTEPMSGISSLLGYAGGPPINSGVMHTDPTAGLFGFASLLIAIHHRNRTGEGQLIDLSHQETSIHLIASQVMEFSMTGETPTRQGNRNPRMAPHGNFPCEGDDSWIAIAVRSNEEWKRLAAIIGDEVLADPRFTDLSGRLEHVEKLERIVARWTSVRDAASITIQLQTEGIPCAPVLKTREVVENPQLVARGFFETVDHPDTGAYLHPGTPWRLSGMPYHPRTPAPGIGQHSVQVLRNLLGLSNAEIDGLVKRGITGDTPDLAA